MKLLSWNVNGIRAAIKKGFLTFVEEEKPDIICLQETKATPDQVNLELDGYHQFWNSAEKKGYSGTAIFTKVKPDNVLNGLNTEEHDKEGRVITAVFPDFYLVTIYVPNSKRDLSRLDYRQKWDKDLLSYLQGLEKTKPVIYCGDLNVAHNEIDLARPLQNRGNAGFTQQERRGFMRCLDHGFVDTFRHFNQRPHHYTWWSYMHNARKKNIGWRIDYFCVSKSLIDRVTNAFILPNVYGSDHCPVGIVLK